ncbi:MAG: hypothetical protein GSR79_03685 [Desulfurococcales archaeon]|nr:hypothetical protein [Desulfurococcales archaeon]
MSTKYLGIPKEPSAAGFMFISTIYGLLLANASAKGWIIGIILLLLHMFTFDPILNATRTWNLRVMIYLGIANAIPYFGLFILGVKTLLLSLTISTIVLGSHFLVVYRRKWRDPYVYITGSAIPVLAALNIPVAVTNTLHMDVLVFWLLASIYVISTSAYIESILPYRKFNPKIPMIIWIPAFISIAYKVFLVIPLAEPTIKFLIHILNPVTINASPREIKRLGWREFVRFLLYVTLLLLLLRLT